MGGDNEDFFIILIALILDNLLFLIYKNLQTKLNKIERYQEGKNIMKEQM